MIDKLFKCIYLKIFKFFARRKSFCAPLICLFSRRFFSQAAQNNNSEKVCNSASNSPNVNKEQTVTMSVR